VFTLRKGTTSQQVAKIAEKIQKVVGSGQARVTQPKIEETQRFTVRLALINRELKRSVTLDAVQKIAEDLGLSDEEQRSLLFAVQHRERR
jgi:transcription initiation factor TFIIIB Brf1 subunit/transcription initiation factor TFIIB